MRRLLSFPLFVCVAALTSTGCGDSDEDIFVVEPTFEEFKGIYEVSAFEDGDCDAPSEALDELGESPLFVAYTVSPNNIEFLRLASCDSYEDCIRVHEAGLEGRRIGEETIHTFVELDEDGAATGQVAHGGLPTEDGVCSGRLFDDLTLSRLGGETLALQITRYSLNDAPIDESGACPADLDSQREEAAGATSASQGGSAGAGGSGGQSQCNRLSRFTLTPL